MTTNGKIATPYEKRLELVAQTITGNTALDSQAALELAVHVLQALDHIPEKIR